MQFRVRMNRSAAWGVLRRVAGGLVWIVAGGSLVLVVFVMSFLLAMRVEMSSTEVEVPDLSGMTLEGASDRVEALDLVLQVVDHRHDPAVASGRILQQVPPAEVPVRRGRKVKLILSLGGRVLEVPDLVGQASRTVAIELRQGGFVPGEEARIPSPAVPEGRVIAQVPPPASPAVPNTRVHRLVSSGPPPRVWIMPDLSGLTREQAEHWIGRSGFRRGTARRVRISGRPAGTVVGQLPLAGYPVRPKDIVELTLAQ